MLKDIPLPPKTAEIWNCSPSPLPGDNHAWIKKYITNCLSGD